ncbi:sensor domain-containing diguanylate cyclase [Thalassotalea euphylliae]|uniref:diguanylate cyclase n=1 Tax=Thalassotalea euphylliae TaxID=1655234 RepID=A0A3E0UFD4_9GAMM|nr:sensor domain-containing diguanylate cyclase [Thalassotalea euphylliae]REL35277.1 sensor domain-containing diguanylate cyclase [Thalassotalea euphylliae]
MSRTVTEKTKQHPIIKINYLPRIIAAKFMLLICGLKLGWDVLQVQYLWLFVLGILYPHITYWLAAKSRDGKRQEHMNMNFDAFLTGMTVSILPDYYFLSTATIVLIANALYIGAFRLLLKNMLAYATALVFAMVYVWPFTGFVQTDWPVKIVNTLFILIHFGTFAILSYYLTRRMIALTKEVQSLSITDPLTGAYNRRYLDANLSKEIHRSQRLNYPITVIFTDLDHFKSVNDEYGHQLGDKVLADFVSIARKCIREDVDWIARFGGEEFIAVLPNADADYGALIAERIRQEVSEHLFEFEDKQVSISSSFGVVAIDNNDHNASAECVIASAEKLIATADDGLYKAKEKGRNRVEVVNLHAQESI